MTSLLGVNSTQDNVEAFKQLPNGSDEPLVPPSPKNDRHSDTLPYLKNYIGGEEYYLNASVINDYFIAAQGPKLETLDDFSRMIQDKKIKTIVTLVMPFEKDRNGYDVSKCYNYWAYAKKEILATFGEVTIVKRKLNEELTQFHLKNWPDNGVVKPEVLLQLIEELHKHEAEIRAPTAVHCSAGVGRTGVFLITDFIIRKLKKNPNYKYHVVNLIKELREKRAYMVRGAAQYTLICKTVKLFLNPEPNNKKNNRSSLTCASECIPIDNIELQTNIGTEIPPNTSIQNSTDYSLYFNNRTVQKITPCGFQSMSGNNIPTFAMQSIEPNRLNRLNKLYCSV